MTPELFDAIGPAGFFGRVDPADVNRLLFDRTTPSDDTAVEVTKPDDRFTVRFVQSNRIVNFAPKWGIASDLHREFETRSPDARLHDESPDVVETPDKDRIICFVEHEVDGRKFTSAPLTLQKRAS